jgi:hypothetical protein
MHPGNLWVFVARAKGASSAEQHAQDVEPVAWKNSEEYGEYVQERAVQPANRRPAVVVTASQFARRALSIPAAKRVLVTTITSRGNRAL